MDAVWRSSSSPRLTSDVAVVGSSPSLRCSSDTTKCYAEALRRCGSSQNLWEGKRLHFLLKSRGYDGDTFLGNLLVQMYGKCGELDQARSAFDRIVTRNVFSWTILILAYFQNGLFRDALDAYQEMKDDRVEPDDFIFSIALGACGALGTDALEEGRAIHSHLIVASSSGGQATPPSFGKSSIVTTGLLDMYAKCGSVEDARRAFDVMERKDIVAWGAIITAYSEHGDGKTTLEMFRKMELDGTKANMYAYSGVLDACSRLGALSEGIAFHSRIIALGLEKHLVVATAIVTMYSRCGRMHEARIAFDTVKKKDLVCWNTLLAGYAQHGHSNDALQLFQEMVMESCEMNRVTFNSILHACSHTGLVELARSYFVSMTMDHGISHEVDHFVRLIDVLGRAGWVTQAEEVVDEMPFQPTSVIWVTLLGCYKMHGRVERAELVADRVLELDPANTAAFVLLSSIYGRVGRWDDVRRIRRAMQERGWKKLPGQSYIEIKNRLHEFGTTGKLHPQTDKLKAELERLDRQMQEAGYVPDMNEVLRDVETMEENVEHLGYHSERVALAFGLLTTDPGTPLQIVKNLRICSECHAAIKVTSRIVGRAIVVRDVTCYHHFEHGQCSCKDHW
ncbi:pentatricopeptide repeat-containing protein At3g24000, mitochondrial-like [Selaginella moellendorffii]|uniref:pentatricopeptide repeat-containing protein At3g24000, mitochondrial-like n=1 Tax=Selaginella moellendorffii TaxID=88036 RepID=UPI000D1CDB52|nr:pentatricopeptide repeat-containing protein At3g24000, mitochondrial-like [Selaginella moellendorffii]|eukprot:XP_024529417.1 pentatricopeptide repeat-containing protein At3g24000, mitochondrial-like [Selaginella moellendorffii]